ncbi:hypothetical protein CRG98_045571 [Punica granatum]|uniref:Uncharacterized protein n=1 Tax=Punica granatum TaxID=22663 RepID=A0A2I0HQQ7_PUNGR|nr:hypothetical protein CRG98_045571 [Punica granatum]
MARVLIRAKPCGSGPKWTIPLGEPLHGADHDANSTQDLRHGKLAKSNPPLMVASPTNQDAPNELVPRGWQVSSTCQIAPAWTVGPHHPSMRTSLPLLLGNLLLSSFHTKSFARAAASMTAPRPSTTPTEFP